jgi:hypothetical protein
MNNHTSNNVISLHEAVVLRGQQAWCHIKKSAPDQRNAWRDVGEALLEGRSREHREEEQFTEWVQEMFPGLQQNEAGAALWFTAEFRGLHVSIPVGMSLPTAIRRRFTDNQTDDPQESTISLQGNIGAMRKALVQAAAVVKASHIAGRAPITKEYAMDTLLEIFNNMNLE